jgi:RNA-directed DNA polymerase
MRRGREQNEALAQPDAGAIPTWFKSWDSIEWNQLRRQVRRLQVRIAKAAKEERWGKAAFLQHILTRSVAARLLAVAGSTQSAFERLEPCAGKLACTVLRGAGGP